MADTAPPSPITLRQVRQHRWDFVRDQLAHCGLPERAMGILTTVALALRDNEAATAAAAAAAATTAAATTAAATDAAALQLDEVERAPFQDSAALVAALVTRYGAGNIITYGDLRFYALGWLLRTWPRVRALFAAGAKAPPHIVVIHQPPPGSGNGSGSGSGSAPGSGSGSGNEPPWRLMALEPAATGMRYWQTGTPCAACAQDGSDAQRQGERQMPCRACDGTGVAWDAAYVYTSSELLTWLVSYDRSPSSTDSTAVVVALRQCVVLAAAATTPPPPDDNTTAAAETATASAAAAMTTTATTGVKKRKRDSAESGARSSSSGSATSSDRHAMLPPALTSPVAAAPLLTQAMRDSLAEEQRDAAQLPPHACLRWRLDARLLGHDGDESDGDAVHRVLVALALAIYELQEAIVVHVGAL